MKPRGLLKDLCNPSVVVTVICAAFLTLHLILTEKKIDRLQKTTADILAESRNATQQVTTRNNEVVELRSSMPVSELRVFARKTQVKYADIWMTPIEINLVLRYMENVQTYFEWGSGGSTMTFPLFASKLAISVEHDESWCNKMKEKIAKQPQLGHVNYNCVPVKRGHLGWGKHHAFEEGNYVQFREYIDFIDKAGHDHYDVVLVDGRARVAAAIKALSYITDDSVVILHDYSRAIGPDRTTYKEVLRYYNTREYSIGTARQGVGILKRRSSYKYLQGNRTATQNILNKLYGIER